MSQKPTYKELANRVQVLEQIELNRKRIERDLQHQTETHKILMNISANCINVQLDKVGDAIQSALAEIGEFVSADRVYVFNYDFEKNIAINTYEWCNKGVEPQIENLQDSPLENAPDWVESHLKGEPLIVPDVSDLPSGALRDILEQQKIKSLIAVPLFCEDSLVGFAGFDSVKKFHTHSGREIELFKFFAQILINLKMCAQAGKALRESEEKYRSFFENSSISLWEEDYSEVIEYMNGLRDSGVKDIRSYFNDRPEEISKCASLARILDVNLATLKIYDAQSKKDLMQNLNNVFTDESLEVFKEQLISFFEGNMLFESDGITKTITGKKNHIHLVTSLLSKHRVLVSITDITASKQAEERIQASEKRFRKIIEDVSEISIQGYDEERRLIFWNNASEKLYGYTEKEVIGKKFEEVIIPPNMREQIKTLHHRWVEYGEKIPAGELILMDKNGNGVPVFSSHVMHEAPHGKEMYCIDIDLKPIKLAEKEKIKAQKIAGEQTKLALIGQVAGKMAHDFNNILGIIMGNTELSLMNCKDAETKKTLELIFKQTLRGKNLTKNLIAFAKSQEPKQEFFIISEKIELAVNLLKKDIEGIELIREDKPGVPDLLADPGMIEHALVNFIQNSIHATSMSEHPKIILRTYCLDENIYFEIEDNGCGISKKYLEKIYEPSFTLKGSNDVTGSYKASIKGTGYGLSNVKKYIEQHKGNISVESEFGIGTKFTISLPVVKTELTSEEKAEIRKEKVHLNKYILIVEDEPAISGVQYKILSQEPCNHKVDIANDGQVAMDLFKRNEYDLISLDYVLPGGINGMDVYHHIRKTDKFIPILFISGNVEFLESIKELKSKDAKIDHLSKPCQNKDYVDGINKLLKSASAAQQ